MSARSRDVAKFFRQPPADSGEPGDNQPVAVEHGPRVGCQVLLVFGLSHQLQAGGEEIVGQSTATKARNWRLVTGVASIQKLSTVTWWTGASSG